MGQATLARGGYAASVVKLALHAPWGRSDCTVRYDLVDKTGKYLRTLDCVNACKVHLDGLGDIKRGASFTLEDDGTVDFTSHRIKPYVLIYIPSKAVIRQFYYLSPWQISEYDMTMTPYEEGWVEFPLGEFLLVSPKRATDEAGTVTREVNAYDQTYILKATKTSGKYLIPAGTEYTEALRMLFESAGITRHNITTSTKVLPVEREWEGGTEYLQIANDLLEGLNYYSVYTDGEGYVCASPYVLPSQAASEYDYRDDELSVIYIPATQEADMFAVPNEWVRVVSETGRPTLRSVVTNTNPSSPTSTVRRGFTVSDYKTVDAADQETLDALTLRTATEDSRIYETITWTSWVMPQHGFFDSYHLTFSSFGVNDQYTEVAWSMDLNTNVMEHTCRRRISV